jgi:hypothetical protein
MVTYLIDPRFSMYFILNPEHTRSQSDVSCSISGFVEIFSHSCVGQVLYMLLSVSRSPQRQGGQATEEPLLVGTTAWLIVSYGTAKRKAVFRVISLMA